MAIAGGIYVSQTRLVYCLYRLWLKIFTHYPAPNIRAWDLHEVLFSKLVFNKLERQFYQTENLAKV